VGAVLININPEYKIGNLGYWVRNNQTGRGVATASTRLLARFGFNELKLNRIVIVVAIENLNSQRVAGKAGAKREGILRNRIVANGQVHDAVMFSLVPQDLGTDS
jgi:ribosomal-protein-serine acetyltransferase